MAIVCLVFSSWSNHGLEWVLDCSFEKVLFNWGKMLGRETLSLSWAPHFLDSHEKCWFLWLFCCNFDAGIAIIRFGSITVQLSRPIIPLRLPRNWSNQRSFLFTKVTQILASFEWTQGKHRHNWMTENFLLARENRPLVTKYDQYQLWNHCRAVRFWQWHRVFTEALQELVIIPQGYLIYNQFLFLKVASELGAVQAYYFSRRFDSHGQRKKSSATL